MKKWFFNNKLFFLGALPGAVAGYLYWKYWGCINGCTITSSPRSSTLYFTLIGMLLSVLFKKDAYANKE